MIRLCKNCNKDITGSHGRKIYCSQECKDFNKKITCKTCNKEFKGSRGSSFCSTECRINKPNVFKIKCETCNKDIIGKSKAKKYCSEKCTPSRNILLTCLNCTKEFKAEKHHKYCSVDCANKHKAILYDRKHFKNNCLECGEEFIGAFDKKFCNEKCRQRNRWSKRYARKKDLLNKEETDQDITLSKLIKKEKSICYICKKPCNENDFEYIGKWFKAGASYPTIEHIIAIDNGGTHTWDNIKLACHHCNSKKSNKKIFTGNDGQLTFSI